MTSDQSATDRIPQPGDRWRHYKLKDDKEYLVTIIGIATYSPKYWNISEKVVLYATELVPVIYKLATGLDFIAQHTEFNARFAARFAIAVNNNGDWLLLPASPLLTTTEKKPVVWARPLSNFLEMLEDKDKGTWFYRFEKVQ